MNLAKTARWTVDFEKIVDALEKLLTY